MSNEVYLSSGLRLARDEFGGWKTDEAGIMADEGGETLADILGAMADRWDMDYWDIGLLANCVLNEVKKRSMPIADMHVFEAFAGWLHHLVGWQTVRYYAQVQAFYGSKDIDQWFSLPFSHFALAMKYPDWEEVLNLANSYMDNHAGRIPSRSWLIEALAGRWYERQVQDAHEARPTPDEAEIMSVEDAVGYDEMILDAPAVQPPVRTFALVSLGNAADKLRRMIDRLPVSGDQKTRLDSLLGELVDLIAEIVKP